MVDKCLLIAENILEVCHQRFLVYVIRVIWVFWVLGTSSIEGVTFCLVYGIYGLNILR